MADFKDEISPAMVARLGAELRRAWPSFPIETFTAAATNDLQPLALMARVAHVAAALRHAMPADFPTAATIVHTALASATFTGWMTMPCGHYVADHGVDHPRLALPVLAALSPRLSSEISIRPFIERHPDTTFMYLHQWVRHTDPHVRRLVSEGTRPRLPWAPLLRGFIADPTPTIALLDQLHDDPCEYVRRSVANHLNDISKDHPDLAITVARRWRATRSEHVDWVIRHGLRSLVKNGHSQALRLLGYPEPAGVQITNLIADPPSAPIGADVTLAFTITADQPTQVVIDYAVHHVGARGMRRPKVFKLTTRHLRPGQPHTITRRHPFREVSVRRLYPGSHRIDIHVNGQRMASTTVTLHRPTPQ